MRKIVRRAATTESSRPKAQDRAEPGVLALQRAAGNQAVARLLARRPAPVAGLPPIADNLTRFFDGAPRLKALANRPAPAVDAHALDLAPALAWLKELADTLDLVEPLADPSMLVFESTLVEGHDGDYGHAETVMKTLLPATLAVTAPAARGLGTRVRDAVLTAMNDSSVISHGPQANPNLPSKDDAIAWREHATKLAALAPTVDKAGTLKDAALALEDAALAILQARAVAEARTTWRAGTVQSSSAPTPHRDELDDVFADSGYSSDKAFDNPGGALADWCGMFAAANLFRASAFDKQLRKAFAHTDNLYDFFNYTANVNDERTPLAMWAEGQWWTVEAYHASRGLKRTHVEGPDAAADIRPGDIALIRHNGVKPAASLADHIVMVESYDAASGRLITIEGNVTEGIRPGADGAADRTEGGDVKWSTAGHSRTVIEERNMRDPHTTFQWGRPAGDVYQPSGRRTVWFVGRPSLIDFEQHEYARQPVPEQFKYVSPAEIRKNAARRGMLQQAVPSAAPAGGPYHKRTG
jgi:hypothetical protein